MPSAILASSSTQPTSSSSSSKPTSGRHTRKKTAENWDDDFEFKLPSTTAAKSSTGSVPDENAQSSARRIPGRSSPTESIISSWDDSPPRSAPVPMTHTRSNSKTPGVGLHLALPRHSPSQISALPSPSSASSSHRHSLASPLPPSDQAGLSRSGMANPNAGARQKLVKRHPSTSFITTSHPSSSSTSVSSSYVNRSSPHLPRMTSREAMPPPSIIPSGLERRKSKGKSRLAGRTDEVRESKIPFSPSQDTMREGERRPSLWKRLSGATTPTSKRHPEVSEVWMRTDVKTHVEQQGGHRRRRSSSFGIGSTPFSSRDGPPVPPVPLVLRSTSAASATSDVSVVSQFSASSTSSSSRSGPAAALSSILRRSSSTLSKQSENSGKNTPPSAYVPVLRESPRQSSHGIPVPLRREVTSTSPPPSSHSFSRGFHLPSPSPGSPYNEAIPQFPAMPPLPHSHSFPNAPSRESDIETEPEAEENDTTPKRKKKTRPVSALPAARNTSRGWDADGWKGFGDVPKSASQSDGLAYRPESRSSYHRPTASEVPDPTSPRNSTFANTASTFRRIGSLSKKHGRRLSSGFKFGTGSSVPPTSSEIRRGSQPLETVAGSPSKINRSPVRKPIPQPMPDEVFGSEFKGGSVSAPNSHFKANTMGKTETIPGMPSSLSQDALTAKLVKQARRRSGGDEVAKWSGRDSFVPDNVRIKQKALKESKEAFKRFDVGIKVLDVLMDQHAAMSEKLRSSGSEADRAIFQRLEADFEQWWEMATVLIALGNTGAATPIPADSPARSRRVTLAAEEAKATADALANLSLAQPRDNGNRSASLPEPGAELSPPAPSAQWRASTGRTEYTKRQLALIRTMVKDPIPSRPQIGRTSSTLSASSSSGMIPPRSAGPRTPVDRVISGVTFPSPSDSNYVVPSASFPSPGTASTLAQPRPPMKTRRSNKTGLAGLKEFLRGLKGSSSSTASRSSVARPALPPPLPSHAASPPLSPSTPITNSFEEVAYPTSRSSLSIQRAKAPSPPRRVPSPRKEVKRPNIRNMFRTSSGNWSDLVKGSSSPVPLLPSRKSIDSNGEREEISGMPRQGILRQPSTNGIKPAKTPTMTSFQLPSNPWRSPKRKTEVPDIGAYINDEHEEMAQAMSRGSSRDSSAFGEVETDRTVRPTRKSRIMGLGMPPSPSSPSAPNWPHSLRPGSQDEVGSGERRVSDSSTWSAEFGEEEVQGEAALGGGEAEDEDLVVELTAENLPRLLGYLQQCQTKLDEWRQAAVEISSERSY